MVIIIITYLPLFDPNKRK